MSTTISVTNQRTAVRTTRGRALTVASAVLAASAVWLVAVPLAGADLLVGRPGDRPPVEVGLVQVVLVAGLASMAGWGLLAVLERRSRRSARIWTVTALAALVLSLAVMHVTVAAVLVPGLRRTT